MTFKRFLTAVAAVILSLCLWMELPLRTVAANSSSEEETDERQDNSGAPDPVQIVYAIALEEMSDLRTYVKEDHISYYSASPEVNAAAAAYGESLRLAGSMQFVRIWSISSEEKEAEDLYREVILALNSVRNISSITEIAASTIIQSLNYDNSYPYDWPMNDDPVFLAEIYGLTGLQAVMICYYNTDGAIQTYTLPVFGELSFDFESIYSRYKDWNVRERSLDILEELISALSEKDLDDYMQMMIDRVAAHGSQDYLSQATATEAIAAYAEKCRLFEGKPYAVLSWNSKVFGEALMDYIYAAAAAEDQTEVPEEELLEYTKTYALAVLGGNVLNGYMGAEPIAASSVTASSYSASGLEVEDTVRWYYYKDQDGDTVVCAVSATRNGNGCYDFSAGPVFHSDFTEQVLDLVRNGGYEALLPQSGEGMMLQLIVPYAEEITP